jgi:hypothetical protein
MLAGGVSPVRVEVIEGQGVTEVIFRRSDRWKGAIKLLLLVPALLFGALFAGLLLAATSGSELMLSAWLVLWGVGGLIFVGLLLWSTFGVESLIGRSDSLTVMRRLLFLTSPLVLSDGDITDIRWLPDDPRRIVRVNGRRIPQTAIEINAAGRRVTCARGIGEADANTAIAAARQRLLTQSRRR